MIWFLGLHIMALLIWCATLLYLPALIAGIHTRQIAISEPDNKYGSVARFLFTFISTPAALLAIISGTLVFLIDHTVEVWLIAKLTLVVALTVSHTFAGLLLLHTQDRNLKPIQNWCKLLSGIVSVLMIAIVWIVLAKPAAEVLP
jgi:putative membrane protein